ncbi:MAG TPA: bacterial transcriptional activator domain-containing protein, partial [Ktedonosporobacter sp.]|nr:bacterial transcriptional activator domain-containing protein [Ktedonosporobacter sp.]
METATGNVTPIAHKQFQDKGGAQVLSLLQVLLCQPGRRAHRDWLLEQFWPEHAQSTATHRLHNITSLLRKYLAPPDGVPLLPSIVGRSESQSVYTLPAYPRLWVDSDAITWNIEQAARLERFGEDALPLWQRAYELLKRGPFLLEDPYATWAHARRSEMEGALRQCVHALSRLYLTRYGETGKAEALLLLRSYWLEHQTDEDVLRPLMELLGEQERYQEAEEYYQQCLAVLDDLGQQPDQRTTDLREFLRVKQLQRKRSLIHTPEGDKLAARSSSQALTRQSEAHMHFSDALTQGILEESTRQDPLHQRVLSSGNTTALASRSTYITSPLSLFVSFDSSQSLGIDELTPETLEHFTRLTDTCRYFSKGNALQIAEQILWAYLPKIERLARIPSTYQQQAASLTSQGYLIAASLVGHRNHLVERMRYSEQAVLYGELAQDLNLYVLTLRQLAISFDYLYRPKQMVQTYQQALPILEKASPLLRACVYADLSNAHAQLGHKQETDHLIGKAYDSFPKAEQQESDQIWPDYIGTICRDASIIFAEGMNNVYFDQYQKAEKIFAKIDGLQSYAQEPDRNRAEVLNYQLKTFIALEKMDEACAYLEAAIQTDLAIGSTKRYEESFGHHAALCVRASRKRTSKDPRAMCLSIEGDRTGNDGPGTSSVSRKRDA